MSKCKSCLQDGGFEWCCPECCVDVMFKEHEPWCPRFKGTSEFVKAAHREAYGAMLRKQLAESAELVEDGRQILTQYNPQDGNIRVPIDNEIELVGLKPSNPKDLIGSDKIPLHLWPTTASIMGALGNLDGMLKYGRNNWREAGVRYTIYLDAIKRHADAILEGENEDPDSGLPHEAHILASAAILVDAAATGRLVDDRNYRGKFYRGFINRMTSHVKRLKDKYQFRNPKHYTIEDGRD